MPDMPTEPLFTPEDQNALGALVTEAAPAAPETTAPAEPPAPEAPAAVVEPAKPAEPAAPSEGLEQVAKLHNETLKALDNLTETLMQERIAKGEPAPKTEAERDAFIAKLAEESPSIQDLGSRLYDLGNKLEGLLEERASEKQTQTQQQQIQQEAELLVKDAGRLVDRFPGLVEADIKKVIDAIGDEKNEAAFQRLSFREIAEHVLGDDYLEARRTPPGVPPGAKPPPSAPKPPANVVTTTVPGNGAGAEPTAPLTGGIREAFADIRASDLAKVGSYR